MRKMENIHSCIRKYFTWNYKSNDIELCNELNISVEEKFFTVDELKKADAAFFCGTALK
jgi:hypothetical protein